MKYADLEKSFIKRDVSGEGLGAVMHQGQKESLLLHLYICNKT